VTFEGKKRLAKQSLSDYTSHRKHDFLGASALTLNLSRQECVLRSKLRQKGFFFSLLSSICSSTSSMRCARLSRRRPLSCRLALSRRCLDRLTSAGDDGDDFVVAPEEREEEEEEHDTTAHRRAAKEEGGRREEGQRAPPPPRTPRETSLLLPQPPHPPSSSSPPPKFPLLLCCTYMCSPSSCSASERRRRRCRPAAIHRPPPTPGYTVSSLPLLRACSHRVSSATALFGSPV
jgi:hypothetical protein